MPIHSLNKGRRAEREIIAKLQPILDHAYGTVGLEAPKLERRGLGLAGEDIVGVSWVSLEIKHRETLALDKWWAQAEQQSMKRNGERTHPVLVYRRNHADWRVRMHGSAGHLSPHNCIVDIDWEAFEYWFYNRAMREVDLECDRRSK